VVIAAHGDSIRTVPVHSVEEIAKPAAGAPPGPAPHLVYQNGPLISAVEVFTIFWGPTWKTTQRALATTVNQFFDAILTSSLLDQMAEYSVTPHYPIGHGKRTGTIKITTPTLRHSVTDAAIQHMLQNEIATNSAVPQPNPNTLYFIYLPPGIAVIQGGGRSCTVFCGYHNDINGQIWYAVMPYPGCAGCTGGLSAADALTSTSSHELCEAITDPIPGQGWYDQANGEIGDICAWKTKKVGAYTVQLEWSNAHNACV
jgi:hypothetical protein